MESVVLEQWEINLWKQFEAALKHAGGTLPKSSLGGLLTNDGFSAKVHAKWGSYQRFLESCDTARFVLSDDGKKVSLWKKSKSKTSEVTVEPVSPKRERVNVVPPSVGREQGTVVEVVDRKKMFIRADTQRAHCPKIELYYAVVSHLRNKSEAQYLRAGISVSFAKTALPPSPNPFCTDVVLLDGVGNDNNANVAKINPAVFTSAALSEAERREGIEAELVYSRNQRSSNNNNDKGKSEANEVRNDPFAPFTVVSDEKACLFACAALRESKMVTLDCEGVNLGKQGGRLCLVQVASVAGVFLFDVLKCPGLFGAGLRALLEDTAVVKMVHDCKMDVLALHKMGVAVSAVFDSQIAYSILESVPSRNFSLADVVFKLIGKRHPQKASAPHLSDMEFWSKRPLPRSALEYAAADVQLLLEVAESVRFKQMGAKSSKSVYWKTQSRIAEAFKLDADNGGDGGGGSVGDGEAPDVYESYAKFGANSVTSTRIAIEVDAEFDKLVECLPRRIAKLLTERVVDPELNLMDVVMDLERPVCFVTSEGPGVREELCVVTEEDIEYVIERCGNITDSNRACVGSSLHRCSVIRDPHTEEIIGLTLRMARSVRGLANMIKDVIGAGKSVLLVGPPGLGKTTLLRDIASTLASEAYGRRVMVVDTNNEIAGEHTLPHRAIGRARRMKVGLRSQQYRRMLEVVQNHTPQTLIIDEVGTKQEVMEAVGVRQRGVQLIATTHGRTLADVILNPHLRDLLGGMNTVILSAQERSNEQASAKTRNERKMAPSFDVCVELIGINKWRLHHDIGESVDVVLRNVSLAFFWCSCLLTFSFSSSWAKWWSARFDN
jgi:stage III sporulation protein SpoIIIAA